MDLDLPASNLHPSNRLLLSSLPRITSGQACLRWLEKDSMFPPRSSSYTHRLVRWLRVAMICCHVMNRFFISFTLTRHKAVLPSISSFHILTILGICKLLLYRTCLATLVAGAFLPGLTFSNIGPTNFLSRVNPPLDIFFCSFVPSSVL